MDGIGKRLRSERTRLGLTQAAMACVGGVAPNAQGIYERGQRLPKADYLQRLSRIGIDINYVVTGKPQHYGLRLDPANSELSEFTQEARSDHSSESSKPNTSQVFRQLERSLFLTAGAIADLARGFDPRYDASSQDALVKLVGYRLNPLALIP
jgi:transcriptional regulator with XRE-family HTH domain